MKRQVVIFERNLEYLWQVPLVLIGAMITSFVLAISVKYIEFYYDDITSPRITVDLYGNKSWGELLEKYVSLPKDVSGVHVQIEGYIFSDYAKNECNFRYVISMDNASWFYQDIHARGGTVTLSKLDDFDFNLKREILIIFLDNKIERFLAETRKEKRYIPIAF